MRMVGGLETPTTGEVLLDGEPVLGPSREKGMVFQTYSSFPWLTVLGNIRFGMSTAASWRPAERERIAQHYLEMVGLDARSPTTTSTGSRAACASAWRSRARLPPIRSSC